MWRGRRAGRRARAREREGMERGTRVVRDPPPRVCVYMCVSAGVMCARHAHTLCAPVRHSLFVAGSGAARMRPWVLTELLLLGHMTLYVLPKIMFANRAHSNTTSPSASSSSSKS